MSPKKWHELNSGMNCQVSKRHERQDKEKDCGRRRLMDISGSSHRRVLQYFSHKMFRA